MHRCGRPIAASLASGGSPAALKTWMRKIARLDPFLVDCARIVLRELTRAATTPPATP